MRTGNVITTQLTPWYRHRWPWLLMAGPAIVVVAGFITMWISFSGADALVVDDYYKQGKAINQDLRRDHVAANLGLQFSLRYDAVSGKLLGQLTSSKGSQSAVPLTLMLVHPTMPNNDTKYKILPDQEGKIVILLPMLERAHWQVQLEDVARTGRLHGQWDWPQKINIDIQPQINGEEDATKRALKLATEGGDK